MQRLKPLLHGLHGTHVTVWTDTDIPTGEPWDREIKDALEAMDVFIALVSVSFGTSKYIRRVELPRAKARLEAGEINVLPVFLGEPSDGDVEWLRKLQRVPGSKSWAEMRAAFPDFDSALKPIRDGIKAVVKRARERKCGKHS
jgi:hypothetical protein